jgi:septum formation protein
MQTASVLADAGWAGALVLVSTSPRRYQILSLLSLPFLMVSPDVVEQRSDRSPHEEARYLAGRKAASVAERFPHAILIGSDTLIALGGEKIGKPASPADARRILVRLRGRPHEVITAVTALDPARRKSVEHVETVRVTMRDYSEEELERYLGTGDSLDKAGAYSLQGQGRSLLGALKGDYLAAVGLPLRALAGALQEMGVAIPVDVEGIYRNREVFNWRTFGD